MHDCNGEIKECKDAKLDCFLYTPDVFFETFFHDLAQTRTLLRKIISKHQRKNCGLFILVPKAAPKILEASHTGPFTAFVKWTRIRKLDWQDAIINYVIEYRTKNDTSTIVVSSSQSSVKLNDLRESSTYTVSVFVNNSVGNKSSEESQFTTNSCKYFTDDNDGSLIPKASFSQTCWVRWGKLMGRYSISSEFSPTIWSCHADFSVFIDRIMNQFLKK